MKRFPEFLEKKTIDEKSNELITDPDHPKIPAAAKADQKKPGYSLGVEDVTGQGNVRASKAKVGVDYNVSKRATVRVEVSRGIHDSQDAAAWSRSVEDENAAKAKYKISF